VKANKNDAGDAEAICEAAQRPGMRFVPVKTVEQQDIQAIHRMRGLMVERRTAQVNQIRGLLLGFWIEVAQGRAALMRRLPEIREDADNGLSGGFRAELVEFAEELRHLDARVAHYDGQIEAIAARDEQAGRLMTIPGIGAQSATALVAAVGEDPRLFQNGRGLAAWLGLVPRQHSTGGRERLLGISKRGDVYLMHPVGLVREGPAPAQPSSDGRALASGRSEALRHQLSATRASAAISTMPYTRPCGFRAPSIRISTTHRGRCRDRYPATEPAALRAPDGPGDLDFSPAAV